MSVKKNIEHFLYISNELATIVGAINVSGAGSGSLDTTGGQVTALPAAGQTLLVIADLASLSDTDTEITITGTDEADASNEGTVVMPARAGRTRAVKVEVGASDLFKTVTGIAITSGGAAGDLFSLVGIPEYVRVLVGESVWDYVAYFDGFDPDLGPGQESVFDHYEIDHIKRTRLENNISASSRYVDVNTGLMKYDGADVSMRIEIRPDGRSIVTEQHFVIQARMSVTPSTPEGEGIVTLAGEGSFKKIARELLVSGQ